MTKNVKVIKIEDYPDRLFSLAEKRFEGGDFVGALSSLDSIKSYNKNGFKLTANASLYKDVILLTAKVYMETDMIHYALEYWFRFLSICDYADKPLAYHGLGTCYYLIENLRLAGYYYDKQLELDPTTPYDYTDEMLECMEALTQTQTPEFNICYPLEKATSDYLIDKAEAKIFDDSWEDGVNLLNYVKKDDANYVGAKLRQAGFYLVHDKEDQAKDLLNRLIDEFPDDKLPYINNLCYLADIGQREEFLALFERFDKFKFDDFSECYKLAQAFSKMGLDELSLEYINKAIAKDPYSVSALFLRGATEYNLKMFDKAESTFILVHILTKNPIAEFYIDLSSCTKIDDEPPRLGTEIALPKYALKAWADEAMDFILKKMPVTQETLPRALRTCNWLYSFQNSLQMQLPEPLITSGNQKIKEYFKDLLLYPDVSDQVKAEIIRAFILCDYDFRTPACFDGVYTRVLIRPFTVKLTKKSVFKKAYAKAFSSFVAFVGAKNLSILKAAEDLYNKTTETGAISRLSDVNGLAAAIIYLAKTIIGEQKDLIASLCGTDKKTLNQTLKIIRTDYRDS